MEKWRERLIHAAREARMGFVCVDNVGNAAHAKACIAILKAFGKDDWGHLYAEARTPVRGAGENARPSDLLLLHPDVGVLLIEVKGWPIGKIDSVNAGTFYHFAYGDGKYDNPWNQAKEALRQLQNATRSVLKNRRLDDKGLPFFDYILALPNVSRSEWLEAGFDGGLHSSELLLADDLQDAGKLRGRLTHWIREKAGHRVPCSRIHLENVREVLGDSSLLKMRDRRRGAARRTGLGIRIDALELNGSRFSSEQLRLANAEFDGRPQLIRGVAGSGKTMVLIKNLVNLVDRNLNEEQLAFGFEKRPRRYGIVCYNESLVGLLRMRFAQAYRQLTHDGPPDSVHIDYMNGFLSELTGADHSTRKGPLLYQRYAHYPEPKSALIAGNYLDQLDRLEQASPETYESLLYDAIYVDEGQDLYEEEYKLLMRLIRPDAKTGAKNIVIFYDDAQNLYGRPRPKWSDLGIAVSGGRTEVMRRCYRNTKQVIEFALNVLLGVQAEIRAQTRQFADIRYLTDNRLVTELDDRWEVNFAERSSDIHPEVCLFASRDEEVSWIESKIEYLLRREHVRSEDIAVICRDWEMVAALETGISKLTPEIGRVIKPSWGGPGNPDKKIYIFQQDALTIGSVKSVKGYDCPIVFLTEADEYTTKSEDRASFYVAATRSKLCLYVTGMRKPGSLAEEAEMVAAMLSRPIPPLRENDDPCDERAG